MNVRIRSRPALRAQGAGLVLPQAIRPSRSAGANPRLLGVFAAALVIASGIPAGADMPVAASAPFDAGPEAGCVEIPEFSERCAIWTAAYDHPSYTGHWGGEDAAQAMDVSPDGSRVFVTGRSWQHSGGDNGFDVATVAYDAATGEQSWVARFDGPEGRWDGGLEIAAGDESVVVVGVAGSDGSVQGATGVSDFLTIVYDPATGEERWARVHTGPAGGFDRASTVNLDEESGRVYVAGLQDHKPGSTWADMVTIAYNLSNGERLWEATYDGPAGGTDQARDSALTADGRTLFVTGSSTDTPGLDTSDFATVAYRARRDDDEGDEDIDEGEVLWVARTGDPGVNERVVAIDLDEESSRVIVVGREEVPASPGANPFYSSSRFLVAAYEMDTGAEAWQARFEGPGGLLQDNDDPAGLVVAGGSALVMGWSNVPTGCSLTTVAYSVSTGEQRWAEGYHVPGPEPCFEAGSIAVDATWGIVYSSGHSRSHIRTSYPNGHPVEQSSYVTVARDVESGGQLWVGRFNSSSLGSDINMLRDSVLSPDGGRLYLTGMFGYQPPPPPFLGISANTWDYGTVAYDTSEVRTALSTTPLQRSKGVGGMSAYTGDFGK